MSKTDRINKRIKRIEDRFRTKVSKGIKGTDMDIEMHERRIEKLRGKHREETINQERNMPESPLGFTMPHSPLNQNDSIAASKAWDNFKSGYMNRSQFTPEYNKKEYNREKNEFYYNTEKKKMRLIPTDDAEKQDQSFKNKLKKWQLPPLDRRSPLNQNGESVGWGTLGKVKLTPEQIEKTKNTDLGFTKQLTSEQIEKIKNTDPGFYKPEKVYNMTPNVSEKEAAGVREKFDRTYMKRGSHAHADSEFEKATYQLMNEGVIKETDNKSMPLIEKRMKENKRNK
jgi:hypothetical protein